mmetsp:Transcript_14965/g.29384  ORF Transcript_14965/g.29384 Transcript_14965/m.29384 type:complete len:90 (-) Transcript_14965:33-302(-)
MNSCYAAAVAAAAAAALHMNPMANSNTYHPTPPITNHFAQNHISSVHNVPVQQMRQPAAMVPVVLVAPATAPNSAAAGPAATPKCGPEL